MENPKIKTKVRHSDSKTAWNIVGTKLGGKHKIARVPYVKVKGSIILTKRNKEEALKHAEWISFCFNNSDDIYKQQCLVEDC